MLNFYPISSLGSFLGNLSGQSLSNDPSLVSRVGEKATSILKGTTEITSDLGSAIMLGSVACAVISSAAVAVMGVGVLFNSGTGRSYSKPSQETVKYYLTESYSNPLEGSRYFTSQLSKINTEQMPAGAFAFIKLQDEYKFFILGSKNEMDICLSIGVEAKGYTIDNQAYDSVDSLLNGLYSNYPQMLYPLTGARGMENTFLVSDSVCSDNNIDEAVRWNVGHALSVSSTIGCVYQIAVHAPSVDPRKHRFFLTLQNSGQASKTYEIFWTPDKKFQAKNREETKEGHDSLQFLIETLAKGIHCFSVGNLRANNVKFVPKIRLDAEQLSALQTKLGITTSMTLDQARKHKDAMIEYDPNSQERMNKVWEEYEKTVADLARKSPADIYLKPN